MTYFLGDVMKFGIDYDGTIADTSSMKVIWIKENLGKDVPPWKTDRTSCVPLIGLENYEKMSDAVYESDLTMRAPEIPGAIKAIKKLAKKGELYIITARLAHRVKYAQEWLASKGILELFSGFRTSDKVNGIKKTKQELCLELGLDILIDDDQRHLVEIKLPKLRKILIKHGSSEEIRLPDIEYVKSWNDVLKLLEK